MSNTSLSETGTGSIAQKKEHLPARKKLKRWVIGSLVGVVLLIGATIAYILMYTQVTPLALPVVPANLSASQIGLDQWQTYQQPLPANALNDPSLPTTPREIASLAFIQDAAGQALIQKGDLTHGLAYMKAAVQADPDNLRYSNDYRVMLRNHQLYQEELNFFSALSKQKSTTNVTIEVALAYVDMMRSCPKPPDGLVCQAQNSYSSISVLDKVLQDNPYNIVARYARGLNHLYWPTLMGHLPKAQVDLQYAVALSKAQAKLGSAFVPQVYVALGDVFAKSGKVNDARNVWMNGLNATQDQQLLQQRLAIPKDQLTGQEDQQLRGLGVYVDTDVSLFWRKR
jgi:tetratricopeptide (TPR) repeat protein